MTDHHESYSTPEKTRKNGDVHHFKNPSSQDGDEDDYEDDYEDNRCGIGLFKPGWLQLMASKKAYVISYCTLSLVQGMFYTYMVSVLSTIEKRFAVSSQVSGFVMTGNEFSQIVCAIFIAYFGSRGHRPRWIAVGMYISAISCVVIALPEFVFPGNVALLETYTNSSARDVCVKSTGYSNTTLEPCVDDSDEHAFGAMALIFIGLFISGIGTLALYSLGMPYMDDNIDKKQVPAYLGITIGLRVIGPASGYMVGGACLRKYHDFSRTPDFGPRDPRWVGAWWLGYLYIASAMVIFASFMILFPKRLPGSKKKIHQEENKDASALEKIGLPPRKDLPIAIKRILSNPLLLAYMVDGSFWLLGVIGFATFLPKYFEAKFGETASGASYVTGLSSVLVMMFGFITSGLLIQKFKPRPRVIMGYSVIVGFIQLAGYFGIMMVKCEEDIIIHGIRIDDSLELTEDCNMDCGCNTEKYTPVCDVNNGITYFSACYLGCSTYNETSKLYSDCACAPPNSDLIKLGKCPTTCKSFIIYIIIMTIARFLNSTERVGGTLIFFRSMDPRDKGLASGIFNSVLCITAFLPATVLYGAVVDNTCLVWEETCGERGNCWIYDTERLGYWLHGLTAILVCCSCVAEILVWYLCKDLKIYSNDNTEPEAEGPEGVPLKKVESGNKDGYDEDDEDVVYKSDKA